MIECAPIQGTQSRRIPIQRGSAKHANPRIASRPGRQSGAALVVGLVLLLVMTVLGVSGMNMATLELTMAGNAEAQQEAFQAAETGIDIAIARRGFRTDGTETIEAAVGDATARAETTFQRATPVPDAAFSLGVGNTGGVQAYHFDVVATGEGPRGARSTHRQSFYVIGPSGL